MCGIAGVVNLAEGPAIERAMLEPMAEAIRHRGPDDEGFYIDPHKRCGLAFRRLAIVDLVTGNQPIQTPDEGVNVVFNGEIYNFRELREELEHLGCEFRTQGDAEVVAWAYARWGPNCFKHFNGMFAIAVWDAARGILTLARDRFGKKPLYYAKSGRRAFFGSELKAILAATGSRTIDPDVLHDYLLWQYVPPEKCIYRDYAQVPPGCYLTIEHGQIKAPHHYWQMPSPEPFLDSYEAALEAFDEKLCMAVRRRLISDVPLGAFLSGGVDSSAVVAMMHELDVQPIRTFSIGFDDARYDETRYAKQVSELFETEHHEFRVTPEAETILETLAYHYDEPFADSSAIPTWYVSRATRNSVTVALTGDAGDEAFGGYQRYQATRLAASMDWMPKFARGLLSVWANYLPHSNPKTKSRQLYRFLKALRHNAGRRYLEWMAIFQPDQLLTGYTPAFRERLDFERPLARFEALYEEASRITVDERAMRADYVTYLPGDLLTKVDRASMAVSLECRSPFLDPELVEFALSLPVQWRRNKRLLKDWAAKRIPREVLYRPKMGFGVPVGEWFRGPLANRVREALLAPQSLCGQIFERSWLERLLDEHQSQRSNHEHRLWSLLMLELWRERWEPTLG